MTSARHRDNGSQPLHSNEYASIPREERIQHTERLKALGLSDIGRWSSPENFKANWSSRSGIVAKLIHAKSRVLDLGCGHMALEADLPPGCDYIPADIVARDERTLLCDLNRKVLPEVTADVVVMLGVIEYIHDPVGLLSLISTRWSRLLMTYNPSDLDAGRDRRVHGWFCNLTSAEMVGSASSVGFQLVGIAPVDSKQVVYEFSSTRQLVIC